MKRLSIFIPIVIAILLAGAIGYQETIAQQKDSPAVKSTEQQKDVYSCPMHPSVRSDKPGKCPKCGMNLEKLQGTEAQRQSDSDMMEEMHGQMMKKMGMTAPDSTHTNMEGMGMSCCRMKKSK